MAREYCFDVMVVGGGPAGLTAALHAIQGARPLRVCLIDRKIEVGIPVRCGEAIGLKGFEKYVRLNPSWIKSVILNAKLVAPSGACITLPGNVESYIIDRQLMEKDLTAKAMQAGVVFKARTTIVSATKRADFAYDCLSDSGDRFTAPCLILAEGIESKIARSLGWNSVLRPSQVISCAFAGVEHPAIEPDTCCFFLGNSVAPGGYAWVFSRGEYQANVGLGVLGSMNSAGKPRKLLEQFIELRYPGARVFALHCGGVPVAPCLSPLVRGGAMVVGDAARQVNCVTGAGLAYAFVSGMTAGTAAARACEGAGCDHSQLRRYHKQWAAYYGKQQRRSYAIKNAITGFSDVFLDEIACSLKSANPQTPHVSRVFLRAFAKHPLLALKAIRLFA